MPEAKTFGGVAPPVTCTPTLDVEAFLSLVGDNAIQINTNNHIYPNGTILITLPVNTTQVDDVYVIFASIANAFAGYNVLLDGSAGAVVNTDKVDNGDISLSVGVTRFAGVPAGAHVATLVLNVPLGAVIYMSWLKTIGVTCLKT